MHALVAACLSPIQTRRDLRQAGLSSCLARRLRRAGDGAKEEWPPRWSGATAGENLGPAGVGEERGTARKPLSVCGGQPLCGPNTAAWATPLTSHQGVNLFTPTLCPRGPARRLLHGALRGVRAPAAQPARVRAHAGAAARAAARAARAGAGRR